MIAAAALVRAEAARSVNVVAGDLTEAVELLARQCGVDIIYNSTQLRGQKTAGVAGRLNPTEAFKQLLKGTPLTVREEGEALLITSATIAVPPGKAPPVPAPATAPSPPDPMDEVTVEAARKEKLSILQKRVRSLEDDFYAAYNRVNDIPDYRIKCEQRPPPLGTRFSPGRVCAPVLKQICGGYAGNGSAFDGPVVCTTWLPPVDFRKHLQDVITRHPELLETLKERTELIEYYEVVRRQKFRGKIFVWD